MFRLCSGFYFLSDYIPSPNIIIIITTTKASKRALNQCDEMEGNKNGKKVKKWNNIKSKMTEGFFLIIFFVYLCFSYVFYWLLFYSFIRFPKHSAAQTAANGKVWSFNMKFLLISGKHFSVFVIFFPFTEPLIGISQDQYTHTHTHILRPTLTTQKVTRIL